MRITVFAAAGLLFLAACSSDGGPTSISDRTGTVVGVAYIDRDADGIQDATGDTPAQGITAALLLDATGDTVARATTGLSGGFVLERVAIGRYRLTARLGALADSLAVLSIDSLRFSVAAGDTVQAVIRLGYPPVSAAAARALTPGRKIVVEGIALNGWSTFGDSTIHVQDVTGALRTVRAAPTGVQAGDSVRVLGTVGTRDGRMVLADAVFSLVSGAQGLPRIDSIGTAAAASPAAALLDAQARIAGAVIQDTSSLAGDRILGVDDGSGRLEVVLDRDIAFNPGPYVPGGTLAASGVLVPGPTAGSWRLKPRDRNEVVVSFPSTPIATVRTMEAGRQVVVQGIALNATSTFGDSTVHVRDATGTLRTVRVTGAVTAGDSVRLIGTTGTRAGQPVLTGVTAAVLRAGVGVPEPDSVSLVVAAAATGGLDAALVRVGGTIVGVETLASGDLMITAEDASGRGEVLFDRDISFPTGTLQPGSLLRAAGLLVPTGTGKWQVKPRSGSDFSATFPTVSIAEARTLAAGKSVYIQGIALNGWVTFGDSTVHVTDGTAAIRVVRLPSSPVFAGDSVRVLGTVAIRNGQPVLTGSSASVLLAGVGLPAADSVSTQQAASARGGTADAQQVIVGGTVAAVSTLNGNVLLDVDDGSGVLRVVLDQDVGFLAGSYTAGDVLRVRGVLVPATTGTSWELKPAALSHVTKQ